MVMLAFLLSSCFLRAGIWSLIFEPGCELIFAFASSREPRGHLWSLALPAQVVLLKLEVYVYVFEEMLAECVLDAGAEGGGDASHYVPEVREVGVIAEDVDPHLSWQGGTKKFASGGSTWGFRSHFEYMAQGVWATCCFTFWQSEVCRIEAQICESS